MRGDLTEADGFTAVQTDTDTTTCQFHYAKSEAELTAKLDALAKTNLHLRDWKKKAD